MGTKRKLFSLVKNEYVYSVLTKFITIAVGILQSVLVARYLGAELKGMNAYITSITSIGDVVISFGLHHAYPYFRKEYGKDYILKDFVSITYLLYAVLEIISIVLACTVPVSKEVRIACVLIPLLGYCRVLSYVSYIETPNLINTWTTIIQALDLLYVAVLWLLTTRSYIWAISILFFVNIVKMVIFTAVLHVAPYYHRGLFDVFVRLVKFGFIPMIALLMTTLNYRIDVLMLHQFDSVTDAMIGVYSLGISLSDKIVLIPDTLKSVLVSKLSKGAADNEVAKTSRFGLWCSVVLCVGIVVLGKPVILLFYGAEFIDAYSVIIITSVGVLAVIYFKLIAQYNIVNKKQNLNVLMLSVAVAVNVVLNMLLIPDWGIHGAAVATSVGNIVCGIVFVIYFCRKTGIPAHEMVMIQRSDLEMLKDTQKKRGK